MTTYARLNADLSFEKLVDLEADQYAAMQVNGKASRLRLYSVDAQPAITATQRVVDAGYVTDATTTRKTWAVQDKTAAEIAAETEVAALDAERAQLNGYITDLNTQLDITNAARALLTNVQRINTLEADTRATMKAVKYLLRRAKQQ